MYRRKSINVETRGGVVLKRNGRRNQDSTNNEEDNFAEE